MNVLFSHKHIFLKKCIKLSTLLQGTEVLFCAFYVQMVNIDFKKSPHLGICSTFLKVRNIEIDRNQHNTK